MQKDKYHEHVRQALEREGWVITHDPYFLKIGRRKIFVDLGAERTLLAAERGLEKIAIEVKSFSGNSELDEFEDAMGQFLLYLWAIQRVEPERELILAVPSDFFASFFDDVVFLQIARHYNIKMLVFDIVEKKIAQWIK
jgi:XisH protein